MIRRTLEVVREQLEMDVAWVAEFSEGFEVFRALDGDAGSFGIGVGQATALSETFCERMVKGIIPSLVPDVHAHPLLRDLPGTIENDIGTYIGVPIRLADASVYGSLCALSHAPSPGMGDREVRLLTAVATLLGDQIYRERVEREQRQRLDEALAAAERANQAKTDFVVNMSHELRNPLTAVMGFSSLLMADPDGDRIKRVQFLEMINTSGKHLLTLINDLLDLSKIESGRLGLNITDCSLDTLVGGLVEQLAPGAAGAGVRLTGSGGGLAVAADEAKLRRALLNLVSNALRFTPPGGCVAISAERRGEEVGIAVQDTGIGIPPEVQETIFEPYAQAHPGLVADSGGTGLGLSLCRAIVQAHGGRVDLQSSEGKGSRFEIVIPAGP